MAKTVDNLIPTRRSLLSRLKNWDDQESWKDFFNTYWKLIYRVALKAGLTESEAQEAVQETVITVAKSLRDFNYDPALGSFKGWLLRTAHWRITDQFRNRVPQYARRHYRGENNTRTSTIERIPDPAGLDLDAVWDAEWETHIFEAATKRVKTRVKPKQYQIFDLYVIKQWPVDKVAGTLGVNVAQVYLAKHRVGSLIKREIKNLENRGI